MLPVAGGPDPVLAARVAGRPVKLVLSRAQMFTSVGYRPPTVQHLTVGARRTGELVAIDHEGIEAMKREAKYLKDMKLKLDAIVTSPLERAQHTAKIAAKALRMDMTEDPLLRPEFNLEALEQLLSKYSAADKLMLVGHEPSFSQVVGQLIGGGTVVMKKGGLARVDLTDQHQPKGELVWLLTPGLLDA